MNYRRTTYRRTLAAWTLVVAAMIVGGSSLLAGGEKNKPVKSEDVTLVGKVVDLQSFMTGKSTNHDPLRAAQEYIRQGVPAALETDEGLIVIGMGERGPGRTLMPLALKEVEVKGKLYEKDGVRYLDMVSAALVEETDEAVEDEGEEEHIEEEESDEEP